MLKIMSDWCSAIGLCLRLTQQDFLLFVYVNKLVVTRQIRVPSLLWRKDRGAGSVNDLREMRVKKRV